jgi:hypothetical protein
MRQVFSSFKISQEKLLMYYFDYDFLSEGQNGFQRHRLPYATSRCLSNFFWKLTSVKYLLMYFP